VQGDRPCPSEVRWLERTLRESRPASVCSSRVRLMIRHPDGSDASAVTPACERAPRGHISFTNCYGSFWRISVIMKR
jgi:hypothetical protein